MQASVTNNSGEDLLIYLDVESTMRAPDHYGFSASPHYPGNKTLCAACLVMLQKDISGPKWLWYPSLSEVFLAHPTENYRSITIIGHNLKFDLHYSLPATKEHHAFLMNDKVVLWDTAVVEYLLSGQRQTYPSLRATYARYKEAYPQLCSIEDKGDLMDTLLADGKTTEDASELDLKAYNHVDVCITRSIHMCQLLRLASTNLLPAVALHNKYQKLLLLMEQNGVHIAYEELRRFGANVLFHCSISTKTIGALIKAQLPGISDEELTPTINSTKALSALLFGGKFTTEQRVAVGTYKSGVKMGETRYSIVPREWDITVGRLEPHLGAVGFTPVKGKNGIFSTANDVLRRFSGKDELCDAIISNRELGKILEYEERLEKFAQTFYVSTKTTGTFKLPYNFNQTVTPTGRLSCSNVNIQNVPFNEDKTLSIKRLFIPRDKNHSFVEIDFQQLEVVGIAWYTGDPALRRVITDGVSYHDLVGREAFPKGMSKEDKTHVKNVNFGTIYGGGPNTLSAQSGIPLDMVTKIQKAFFNTFTNIKPYRALLLKNLNEDYVRQLEERHKADPIIPKVNGTDINPDYVVWESPTGRNYCIDIEAAVQYKGKGGMEYQPHYTSACNYPVQGICTGDIFPLCAVRLVPKLMEKYGAIPVATIHDSILLEVPTQKVQDLALDVYAISEKMPSWVSEYYGIEFDLPLRVSVKSSDSSWHDMTEVPLF